MGRTLCGAKTEEWSDDEERTESRSGLTENRSCIEVVYTTRPEVGVGWGVTQSIGHLLGGLLQKLIPSGVFERELVGVYFESISDGSVHDGLCPFAERSLGGDGLDKLSVALTEWKANHADPLDM
jgi:hypothetical protein